MKALWMFKSIVDIANASTSGADRNLADISYLAHIHDLHLLIWGSYDKKDTSISHIPDLASSLQFELSV